jgi:SAM-dependent methyltransferase
LHEATKAALRRGFDRRFATRWFVGNGIDVGAGNDSLDNLRSLFPLMTSVRGWDVADGDAQFMAGVADETFDFVHSSHCLEHLANPAEALENWLRICRPGGHLVVTVPDEDLYEQGVFPSTFNPDHKVTFTICRTNSWSTHSINVFDLIREFSGVAQCLKVELLDSGFFYGQPRWDQTLGVLSESAIEFVLKKT